MKYPVDQRNASRYYSDLAAKRILKRWEEEEKQKKQEEAKKKDD